MRTAHASIALGPEAEAASSVATATLVNHDFSIIPKALLLARFSKKRLTRILAFTLIYNLLGIALAAGGLLHPVLAAILMLASSITVLATANRFPSFDDLILDLGRGKRTDGDESLKYPTPTPP